MATCYYNQIDFNFLTYIKRPEKKIRIVILCTPNYIRGKDGVKAFRNYASKYGYDFKLYEEPLLHDLHINFTKMEIMRRELLNSNIDYTVLFDADISIKKSIRIENIIDYVSGVDCIAMPKDVVHGIIKGKDSLILRRNSKVNAGFIIGKNCKRTSEIMGMWISDARGECKDVADIHP